MRRCEQAARAGVEPGMTLAHARALLPAERVRVLPFQPQRDARALTALAEWATRFSPLVAPDPPDGLLLDIDGCQRLFGGDERLLRLIAGAVARLGLNARLAVAGTFGAAWAFARFGGQAHALVPDARLREALEPLPVRALRVEAPVEAALREVGVVRVGELLAIPRSQLAARFPSSLLLRVDQALGAAIELIEPVRPEPPLSAEREFAGPTASGEGIAITVRELLDELARGLLARGRGVLKLRVRLVRSDLPPAALLLSLSRPSRDARHLWRLIAPRLERAPLGFGVESIECTALRTGLIRHRQEQAWDDPARPGESGPAQELAELVDQLANRLGPGRVTRVESIPSYLPERAFVHRPWLDDAPGAPRPGQVSSPDAASSSRPHPPDRPSLLLDPPEPVQVVALVPDGPIARLRWRGGEHLIVQTHGPERVALEWWRPEALPRSVCRGRDYFRAQARDGRWLWLFREVESGQWFIHGHWA